MIPPPPRSTLFPYTTLFRSHSTRSSMIRGRIADRDHPRQGGPDFCPPTGSRLRERDWQRSEEHTSELQSRLHLVCRLLLEKKKKKKKKKKNKTITKPYKLH